MRAAAGAIGLAICGFLVGCSAQAVLPADLAQRACVKAQTVPMIGTPNRGSYEVSQDELVDWADVLRDAADDAATAAAADSAYDRVALDVLAVSEDLATARDVIAAGRAILGDDMTAIQDHITTLVETCQRLGTPA